jgi:hypothetical protein
VLGPIVGSTCRGTGTGAVLSPSARTAVVCLTDVRVVSASCGIAPKMSPTSFGMGFGAVLGPIAGKPRKEPVVVCGASETGRGMCPPIAGSQAITSKIRPDRRPDQACSTPRIAWVRRFLRRVHDVISIAWVPRFLRRLHDVICLFLSMPCHPVGSALVLRLALIRPDRRPPPPPSPSPIPGGTAVAVPPGAGGGRGVGLAGALLNSHVAQCAHRLVIRHGTATARHEAVPIAPGHSPDTSEVATSGFRGWLVFQFTAHAPS